IDTDLGRSATLSPADDTKLLSSQLVRVDAQLAPIDIAPPSLTGVSGQGQTLTAGTGNWAGTPTSYAYQWSSCDSAGANCTPSAGATQSTYVVQPSDSGHTVQVTVTATNRFGGATASSSPTLTFP